MKPLSTLVGIMAAPSPSSLGAKVTEAAGTRDGFMPTRSKPKRSSPYGLRNLSPNALALLVAFAVAPATAQLCEPTDTVLQFDGGYEVSMCYVTPDGPVGHAKAGIWASGQSGLLWFFSSDNAEVLVKVLDGCKHNGHFWVFVAPVTTLEFNLRVTGPDGRQWSHTNSQGQTATVKSDLSAFKCASSTPPPTERLCGSGFDLDPYTAHDGGIAYVAGRFYVVDGVHNKVHAYDALRGRRLPAYDFDLAPDNQIPKGVTFASGLSRFYVVDSDDWVYAYDDSGRHVPANDFELARNNRWAQGITYGLGRIYVVDRGHGSFDPKVYAYDASGQHLPAHDFDLASDHDLIFDPAIAYASGHLYVPHETYQSRTYSYTVRAYDVSGQSMPASGFDLLSNHGSPAGITYAAGENAFYLTGFDDHDPGYKVFRYDGPALAGRCVGP